jgi:hypothetical protein
MYVTSGLLPTEIAEKRASVLVADSLRIPAHPHPLVEVGIGQLHTQDELYARSRLLHEERVKGASRDERLAFVDKAQPHAIHDFMAISSGPNILSSPYHHSSSFMRSVLGYMYDFACMAKRNNLQPVVSWSYDPYTNDRASGQGEKRFHAHFVGRTAEEVATVHKLARPLGELSLLRQRRIADEFATVGSRALYDVLQHTSLPGITLVEPGTTPQSLLSLQFEFSDGWTGIAENPGNITRSLASIDFHYHDLFENFLRGITHGSYGHWERPVLVSNAVERSCAVSAQSNLGKEAADIISHYIQGLNTTAMSDVFIRKFQTKPNDDLTAFLYPLGGISYTTCISEINEKPMGHIRPNMFTDLGGAGVALVDGITTKVKKTEQPMSADDFASRQSFQRAFISALT